MGVRDVFGKYLVAQNAWIQKTILNVMVLFFRATKSTYTACVCCPGLGNVINVLLFVVLGLDNVVNVMLFSLGLDKVLCVMLF